jgi:hypothetical protein
MKKPRDDGASLRNIEMEMGGRALRFHPRRKHSAGLFPQGSALAFNIPIAAILEAIS